MILNPGVIALLGSSLMLWVVATVGMVIGATVVFMWNPDDSGPGQLAREKRGFLIDIILRSVLGFQLVSVCLFVLVADRIHLLLTGAMCAAGTLNANPFGYPALTVKLVSFVLCGLWLVVNRASAAATSTGIVRFKYAFLVLVWASLLAENILQLRFFAELDPEIITSCCATVFMAGGEGAAASLAEIPVWASRLSFFGLLALTLVAGVRVRGKGRTAGTFSVLAALLGLASVTAIVSWVAPGFYELPTHHCPFCLLSPDVGCVGYPLFLFLSIAVVAGVGSGLVGCARSLDQQHAIKEGVERRLCVLSMYGFALFSVVAMWPMVTSDFRLQGY